MPRTKQKPDPIQLGRELAAYIHRKEEAIFKVLPFNQDTKPVHEAFDLMWERDFWRAKALGVELV